MLTPTLRQVRLLALTAIFSLAACGGGGGGGDTSSGGSGGSTTSASLSVSPTQLLVNANGDASSIPTGAVTVTVSNASPTGTYIGATFTKNAITALSFVASGEQGTLTVTFKDPSVLGPGKYSDTIQVFICTDSTCTSTQSGSQVTVSVTYTVTLDATVSLSASPTTVGAGLPTTLTWSSTHAQSCTASGEWSGALASSGSQAVTPATPGIHSYSISCGSPGAPAQATVTVTAAGPTLSLTAFPPTVTLGKPVTLRWQGQYASGCVASGGWTGTLPASGFQTLTLGAQGTTNFHLVCSNSAASAQQDASVTVTAAPAAPPATAYRMNEAHDGVLITSNGAQFPPQTAPTWTRNLNTAPVSYPLIVSGTVYVVTANQNEAYGNQLYALNASTGATLWGPVAIAGTYFGSGLTYENGRLFVLMFDGGLHAFDATTGAVLWTAQLPGYWYEATPNAYGGVVFVTGNGGLSAVDEATGNVVWTNNSGSTDWASPAVSSAAVFMSPGEGCTATASDPLLGTVLWSTSNQCSGSGWGYASILKNGIFFGRVGATLSLFNAETGAFQTQVASGLAPAITATAIIAVNGGILSSTRLSDLVQTWTFSGTGNLVTAPVVVNNTVFVGEDSGNVYGLDAGTGAKVWTGVAPGPINNDSENGGPMPPSGPAAGEDLLIFIAGNSLVAWKLQ
jgi:outer membrane protein assembly factor BamB